MSRVLTSFGLLAFATYALFYAPPAIFMACVVLLAALCYHEFSTIARGHGVGGMLWIGHVAGILFVVLPDSVRLSTIVVLAVALGLRELPKVLLFAASVMLGVLYVYGGWRCAVDLRTISVNWLLFALAVNWAGDISAYYVGRAIGKHKLFPRVSPGKSWEGAVASMAGAVALGWLMHSQQMLPVPLGHVLALAVAANIAGQLGDLAESAMKRGAGVKDSGNLLPGHGGFLDRLDSSLFTMPVVYYYLMYRGFFMP